MVAFDMTDKQFVYKLIISQLHHDGYNALALLMEKMLLSSQKVQPSDWLTQLLKVCKAVSVADRDLLLDREGNSPSTHSENSSIDKPTERQKHATQTFFNDMTFPAMTKISQSSEIRDRSCVSPDEKTKLLMPSLTSPLSFLQPSSTSQFPLVKDFLCSPTSLLPTKLEQSTVEENLFQKDSLQDVLKALSTARPSVSTSWKASSGLLGQPPAKQTNRQHKLKNCPICRKVLVASSLYLHMKIHSGEKNYKCEFCSKKFLLKHHLHSHLKICPNRRTEVLE
ncbi:hypothetical protein ACHWQZ_G003345 [Mnemiopsis leidyi]